MRESGYRITVLPEISNLLTGVRLPLPAQNFKPKNRPNGVFFIFKAVLKRSTSFQRIPPGDFGISNNKRAPKHPSTLSARAHLNRESLGSERNRFQARLFHS